MISSIKYAALMLVVKDGKILAVSRGFNSSLFGIPGGKQEPGETPRENAIRECLEETGVHVKSCEHFYCELVENQKGDGQTFMSDCFYALKWDGDITASNEGNVEWLTSKEITIDKAAFPEYNKNCIEAFRRHYPNVKLI